LIMLIFFCLQLITGLIRRDPTALSGRARTGQERARVVPRHHAHRDAAGDHRPADHRDHPSHRNRWKRWATRSPCLPRGSLRSTITAPGVGAIITIFLAGLAITAAAIVWFSLLIRKALLLVAIVLGPIAISGASWDATRGWFGKWASFVIA
jgi:Flp pilus assembly protein TadB